MDTTLNYYFPNRLGRITLLAFEEVMGKNGLNATLNLASLSSLIDNYPPDDEKRNFPFEILSQLQIGLEQGFGPRGGRGLALRTGRIFFSHGLRTYGPELGLNNTTFRFQPPDLKLLAVLRTMTDFFNQHTDQKVSLQESEYRILWEIERCPWCWGRQVFEPVCQFTVGMLQEALYWVSGGKFYNVVEETCIAQGDSTCLIVIDREPLT
ncbi:MAG: 4-vinyl reductase [Anaerolineales bacterium]